MTNPLIENKSTTPEFSTVEPEHFMPALEAAEKQAKALIEKIKDCDELPTFENTVEPLEELTRAGTEVYQVFSAFYSNKNSKAITDLYMPLSKKGQSMTKAVFQDDALAARFRTVYEARDKLGLTEEQHRVLQELYSEFEDSGTLLSPQDRQELNDVDNRLIEYSAHFKSNAASAANYHAFITDASVLAGVPEDARATMQAHYDQALAGMQPDAKGDDKEFYDELSDDVKQTLASGTQGQGYLFVPERLAVDTLLGTAENRDFRKKMFQSLNSIGTEAPYNNEPPIRMMQDLRQKRVEILNRARPQDQQYKDYTDYALSKTMAGSLKAVETLFDELEVPLLEKFEAEIDTLRNFAAQNGQSEPLEPWDVPFWTEKYKERRWGYSTAEFSEYLEVNNVIDGFIEHASNLFNINLEENNSYETIHPDVKAFDVYDEKGDHIGIMHMDLFARTGKHGGAWATTYQSIGDDKPVVAVMNCNLPKPAAGQSALVDPEQVETFFHEAGHAMNMLLGTRSKYKMLHGTGAHPSDFTEHHAMVQERWAFAREVLKKYAKHYQTGESIPDALIDAKEASESFMAGRQPLLIIQNARRDFLFHSMDPRAYRGTKNIHEKAKLDSANADLIRPYALTRFDHLFSSPQSSYAAGYYSYLWADRCAADIYSFFQERGLYDTPTGMALREYYADGCARTTHETFNRFAGRPPSSAAYLKEYGLNEKAAPSNGNKPHPS